MSEKLARLLSGQKSASFTRFMGPEVQKAFPVFRAWAVSSLCNATHATFALSRYGRHQIRETCQRRGQIDSKTLARQLSSEGLFLANLNSQPGRWIDFPRSGPDPFSNGISSDQHGAQPVMFFAWWDPKNHLCLPRSLDNWVSAIPI